MKRKEGPLVVELKPDNYELNEPKNGNRCFPDESSLKKGIEVLKKYELIIKDK